MAIMIPSSRTEQDFNGSWGEKRLWDLLHQLPDEYYIFHSLRWNEQRPRGWGRGNYLQWGEADFVLFNPTFGIIVFEVKDGLIQCRREDGLMQQNRKTKEWNPIDPMKQAERSKYYFRDHIQEQCGENLYPLCSAVWFTSGDRTHTEGSLPLDYAEELVLWQNDMADLAMAEKAIKRVFRYSGVEKRIADSQTVKRLLDVLVPEFRCFPSIRSHVMETETLFQQMTKEQSYLLDYLEEQDCAAIHGMAGTGKTVLAVQKAQRLSEDGPVLFLCFNRLLKEYLADCYPHQGVRYNNLPGLYYDQTQKQLPPNSQERDDVLLEFLMDWENIFWSFKHIIVDEGQDFNGEHLELLREIAENKRGCFYVFFDKNQFVQGMEYPMWLEKMECRLVLSRNCRNTREIALTSTRPINIPEERVKTRWELEGCSEQVKPTLFFVRDKVQLEEYIIKLLGMYYRNGIAKEDMVVLSCKGERASILDSKGETTLRLGTGWTLSHTRQEKTVLFTTVRKFKGLEAKVVICIDIDGETFFEERKRNAFYVGTSRATTYLNLITTTTPETLATALRGGEQVSGTRCRKVIRDNLCVKIGDESNLGE